MEKGSSKVGLGHIGRTIRVASLKCVDANVIDHGRRRPLARTKEHLDLALPPEACAHTHSARACVHHEHVDIMFVRVRWAACDCSLAVLSSFYFFF